VGSLPSNPEYRETSRVEAKVPTVASMLATSAFTRVSAGCTPTRTWCNGRRAFRANAAKAIDAAIRGRLRLAQLMLSLESRECSMLGA
jgi:hypothetical protein